MKITTTSPTSRALACAALTVAIAGGIALQAQQKDKINAALAKAPQAVQETVKQLAGGNHIDAFGTDTTLEGTFAVLEITIKGREYAFGIDDTGNVAARWVGVDPSTVPPAVLEAAKKAHPDEKLYEVTIVTSGKRMLYNVDYKTDSGYRGMEISPEGSMTVDRIKD